VRRLLVITALALTSLVCIPVTARATQGDPPCPDGQTPDPSGLVCVFVDKATTGVDAKTQPPAPSDPWLTTALELQHRLGDALPLRDATWVGTHNSFNTVSDDIPTLSNQDSNQHLSLAQQLDAGIRALEIDVHWTVSPWSRGAKAPVVCHGRPPSEGNLGCSFERRLVGELPPVGAWLRQHPGDVVLLYVEDAIDEPRGYDAAAKAINDTIGDLVYKPPAKQGCPLLPLALRRADVLAAGKQVVVMSGCGSGSRAWTATVFDDSVRSEEGNPEFAGYPACTSPSVVRSDYGTKLVRFYEDSTFVSTAVAGGDPGRRLTAQTLQDMNRCGVNLFGLDQVDPSDPRLEAMVWSWAQAEPVSSEPGMCAVDGADGRFHAVACGGAPRPFACVDPATGAWTVTAAAGSPAQGPSTCSAEHAGSVFAVPGSGAHAQRLREAKGAAGVAEVWLAYAVDADGWRGAPA
jgi:hypothetical protein